MSKATKATIGLMIITIISKALGFIREQVLSYTYGIGIYAEAYITAMNIPSVIFAAIGSALITTFIPIYIEAKGEKGELAGLKFANNALNIAIIISLVLSIIGYIFAEPIVKLFAMSFEGEKLEITINLLRIMIFGIVFIALSNMMTAFLQSNHNFIIPGFIAVPYNIIIIISIILSGKTNIYILAIGTIIAILSQFLLQLPFSYKNKYRYKPYINLKDEYIKKMIQLIGPIFIGVAVNQINVIVDRSIASTLGDGVIPALNYASRLDGFVQGLFIASIISVVYPMISALSYEKNNDKMVSVIVTSINSIICLVIPMAVGAIILSKPIVKLVFERGAFDENATSLTAIALSMYSIGMIAYGLRDILGKVFYSLHDTKTPMKNGILAVIMNIILNIVLVKIIGYPGLPLATSISAIICTILLFKGLKRKLGYFGQDKILKTTIKTIISAVIMGVIVYISYNKLYMLIENSIISDILVLGITIGIGAVSYIILIALLKVEEINIIINKIMYKKG